MAELLANPAIQQVIFSGLMFFVVWMILGNLVFKPFFETLEQREARTLGDLSSAKEKRAKAKDLELKIEDELKVVRMEALRGRESELAEAKKTADEILTEANARAEERIMIARNEMQSAKSKAERDLSVEAEKLAAEVVARALGTGQERVVH